MIRTIYRFTGEHNISSSVIENWEAEVNDHLRLGWKIRSTGMLERYIYAIVEKRSLDKPTES